MILLQGDALTSVSDALADAVAAHFDNDSTEITPPQWRALGRLIAGADVVTLADALAALTPEPSTPDTTEAPTS